jgi:CHAD domain-containing protein
MSEKELNGDFYFNLKYLDGLQDKIGDWHDNELAVQLFSSPQLNDKAIIARIKKKNAVIKRRITLMAKDFLSKANGN